MASVLRDELMFDLEIRGELLPHLLTGIQPVQRLHGRQRLRVVLKNLAVRLDRGLWIGEHLFEQERHPELQILDLVGVVREAQAPIQHTPKLGPLFGQREQALELFQRSFVAGAHFEHFLVERPCARSVRQAIGVGVADREPVGDL